MSAIEAPEWPLAPIRAVPPALAAVIPRLPTGRPSASSPGIIPTPNRFGLIDLSPLPGNIRITRHAVDCTRLSIPGDHITLKDLILIGPR